MTGVEVIAPGSHCATCRCDQLHPVLVPGQLHEFVRPHERLAGAWLASYRSPKTMECYRVGIRQFFGWCDRNEIEPLAIQRGHVDLFLHQLEIDGRSPRTRALRLTTIRSFFNYLVDEELIAKNPTRRIMPPKVPKTSPTAWLKQGQLFDLIDTARDLGPHPYALVVLLAFNGLRIAELCSIDVENIEQSTLWPKIQFVRKGGDEAINTLSAVTWEAVKAAIGDRTEGPLILTSYGTRMNQRAAQRIIDKAVKGVRGPHGRITPHSLRHSAATVAQHAGVPVDQICHDFGWSSPAMLQRIYGHAHGNPARSSTHMITAAVMSIG